MVSPEPVVAGLEEGGGGSPVEVFCRVARSLSISTTQPRFQGHSQHLAGMEKLSSWGSCSPPGDE